MNDQIRFATNYFFDAGLYMPKLSMLVFYFSLIPRHHTVLRWALYVVTAFTASATAVTTMSDTFWCGANLSTNWLVLSCLPAKRHNSAC